jgi:hypothetical protein
MSAGAGAGAGARVVCSGEGVDDVVANAPECCGLWLAVVWYWLGGWRWRGSGSGSGSGSGVPGSVGRRGVIWELKSHLTVSLHLPFMPNLYCTLPITYVEVP